MAENTSQVAVYLPADLVARMEELKQDREADRDKPLEELVKEMCRTYVRVRELARKEAANKEQIEQSYGERPSDWDDADEWERISTESQDTKP